jgi:hypothetical protein
MIETFNDWHLGDNLVHLNFLRRVAKLMPDEQFVHAARGNYLPQLAELVDDVPNVSLVEMSQRSANSIDSWKNRHGNFYNHPKRLDWVAYHLEFFQGLAADLGVTNPIASGEDLLFDYPRLKSNCFEFDYLVVNSTPLSQQLTQFNNSHYESLIGILLAHGRSVLTTQKSIREEVPSTQEIGTANGRRALSVADIGAVSLHCKGIIGCVTGPMWTTMNVHNPKLPRIFLLDEEYIKIPSMTRTHHARTLDETMNIMFIEKML